MMIMCFLYTINLSVLPALAFFGHMCTQCHTVFVCYIITSFVTCVAASRDVCEYPRTFLTR